jgi:hypothetical protein
MSNNYVGGLFPNTTEGIDNFMWNNEASIVVTNPLDENNWVNSRLIASTSGVAYTDFIQYLQSNFDFRKYFIPPDIEDALACMIRYMSFESLYLSLLQMLDGTVDLIALGKAVKCLP